MARRDDLVEAIQQLTNEMITLRSTLHPDPWMDSQLSMAQLKALFFLYRGPARVGRVAETLTLSPNATTSLLDHLEEAGFVQRQPDPSDRRAVLVQLSDTGVAAVDEFLRTGNDQVRDDLGLLSVAELQGLLVGIEALHRVLRRRIADQEAEQTGDEPAQRGR